MTRKLMAIAGAAMLLYSCSTQEENIPQPIQESPIVTQENLNQSILDKLIEHDEFEWSMLSPSHVLTALVQEDSILTVGYQPEGFVGLNTSIHQIDISSDSWVNAKVSIMNELQNVFDQLGTNVELEDRITIEHDVLPYFKIKVHEVAIINKLRELSSVRYAEPQSFTFVEPNVTNPGTRVESGAGCGVSPASNIPSSDFVTVSPGSKVPWNFYVHNIPSAWNYSTGDNITVGLIDTGISDDQAKLNSQYSSGQSTGRFINKYGTYVSSWWWWANPDGPDDRCGHGTQMAGTIVAPRTSSGSIVGVAYNANMAAVRGTSDVVINGGREKDGVSDALVLLGNRSDVRVISMSIGDVFSSGQVKDAVRYAYGKGKMIIAAAGTSLTWTSWWGVIFPANMSETVAVTGIKDNGYNRCDICHDGSKVDFTVTMQRASNTSRNSLTLAMSGNQPAYVGGSSTATATTAGIAAMIWATNPSQSRADVLDRMKRASDFYPNRNGNFGWGNIDALQAVTN
ncbi:MAG: S8/S53 family peptidase [bacterium]|nr:S8/S53 family peptidase [bacterium]